jgi:hypothetical protein
MCTVCRGVNRRWISRATKMPIGYDRRAKRRFTVEDERDPAVVIHAAMVASEDWDERVSTTSH